MDILAIIISALAFIFSGFTYLRHDKKIKEQSSLINRYHLEKIEMEKIEEKKAIIEANIIPGSKGSRIIKVYNKGKCTAKNVIVRIPESNEYHVFKNPSPIDIRPQNGIEIKLGAFIESHLDKVEIKFEWSDDLNENNTTTQMIQI